MTPAEFMGALREFQAPSWAAWQAILARLTPEIREFWCVAGRGSGKSRIAAVLACYYALRKYARVPGEVIYIGVFAPDRRQAKVTLRYVRGLLRLLATKAPGLIVNETQDSIELSNGVIIEVITATLVAPRGRSYACAIIEEAPFLPTEESANPDTEILRAIRPALARVPNSLLVVIGTPYAPQGELWNAWRAGSTEDRLVIAQDTRSLNPTFSPAEIARAFRDDPVAAWSEYGQDGVIRFREDVAGLLTEAMLGPVVPAGLRERPPDPTRRTEAAFDAATGTGQDAAGFAIAFVGPPAALACVRRWRPPFDPAAVIADAARLCIAYGVQTVRIDRYAPGFVAAFFREHGITATVAERTTSQHFLELLGLITAQRVTLLDVPELLGELRRLERRPGSGGQDAVSHPPGGHDDVVAAAASALVGAQVIAHHHGMPISVGDGGSYWRDSDESPWRGAGAMRGWP